MIDICRMEDTFLFLIFLNSHFRLALGSWDAASFLVNKHDGSYTPALSSLNLAIRLDLCLRTGQCCFSSTSVGDPCF